MDSTLPKKKKLKYYRVIWLAKMYAEKQEIIFQDHYKFWKQVHNQQHEERRWITRNQDIRQQLRIHHKKNDTK